MNERQMDLVKAIVNGKGNELKALIANENTSCLLTNCLFLLNTFKLVISYNIYCQHHLWSKRFWYLTPLYLP